MEKDSGLMIRERDQKITRLEADVDRLEKACANGLNALACAVESGGGNPETHYTCVEMRDALRAARGEEAEGGGG